jgi:ATP-binding cassette subfamily B protein
MLTAWPYLRRYKRGLTLGFGALIMKDAVGVSIPLVIKFAIDAVTDGEPLSRLFWLCAALLALTAIKGWFMYQMRVILVGISRDVEYDIRNELFWKLTTLDLPFFHRYRTGDLMARATSDTNAVRMMLGPALMYWVENVLTFILACGVMLYVDWRLTLWALSPAPLISIVVAVFGQRIHHRFEKIQSLVSDISSRVQENFGGVRVVRAYVQEDAELALFEDLNRQFIKQNIHMARLSSMFMPLLQAMVGLTFLAVLWAGGMRLLAGEITMGSFVMFNTFMGLLVWPLIAFGWVVNLTQRGRASLTRLKEILDAMPAIAAPPNPVPLPAGDGDIEFSSVRVSLGGREALSGIDLKIRTGETVAVIGRTGSGKSTLVHLVPRLIDATEGAVLIGGVDLRRFDPTELRGLIGFVPQETFLFSGTLAANIAFGRPSASHDQIMRAVELAGLDADLASFPNGLDTVVGERGLTLSGGQKQRTAIARAVLLEPRILILDDALSAVDTVTEERILSRLRAFMEGRTTIIISHRVSTVRHAGRILVLDHGRIVESGTPAELVEADGYYAELDRRQSLEAELETL